MTRLSCASKVEQDPVPPARAVGGARQRTPLRQRPGSPLRMLPNGKLARQRVLLLPNDGGLSKSPVAVSMLALGPGWDQCLLR